MISFSIGFLSKGARIGLTTVVSLDVEAGICDLVQRYPDASRHGENFLDCHRRKNEQRPLLAHRSAQRELETKLQPACEYEGM